MSKILILYYSEFGSVKEMALNIARGVASVPTMEACVRTVPKVTSNFTGTEPPIPEDGAVYVTLNDLAQCAGLALGSPTHFANMAAPLKYFIDSTTTLWLSGALVNKPATVFTSTGSLHGGQETTLLSMMLPLLHLGFIMLGIPPTESDLISTQSGGSPYGVTHYAGANASNPLTAVEKRLCFAQGKRLAIIAKAMENNP
jgi:NAD(P)H dehydrogenase (quinone)